MAITVDFCEGMRVRVMWGNKGSRAFEGWATIRKINQGDAQGVHADVAFDDEPETIHSRWIYAQDQPGE